MMVDTTVYGYIFDGYALHSDCVDDAEDIKAVESNEATDLFSHMYDDPEGLTCDGCGSYIFEPDYERLVNDAIVDIIRPGVPVWVQARHIMDLFGDDETLIRLYLETR